MKKIHALILLIIFVFSSCEKNNVIPTVNSAANKPVSSTIAGDPDDQLKKAFGKSLAKALGDSKELRDFIKSEALKKFDKDYDVLYHLIKDQKLSNGKSIHEFLLPYFDSKETLERAESNLPLLTIFIPELPRESFSAQQWDTESQIPDVAIALTNSNDVTLINATGEESMLEARFIPGFPVVVIKNNERVTLAKKTSSKGLRENLVSSKDGLSLEFVDNAFNNLVPGKKNSDQTARLTRSIDQKLIDARNLGIEWHRDYIYYNLTPDNQKGPFSYDFMEYITNFQFVDGSSGYQKIADQTGDPQVIWGGATGWTDGQFEFRVTALVNGKITAPTLNPVFIARGSDLFDVLYDEHKMSCGLFCKRTIYTINSITSKSYNPNVPLINWDLDAYSSSMVIKFKEWDLSETITEEETVSSKFATNFEINGTTKMKIGFKFGASLEQNTSQSHSRTYTLDSDYLGETVVNFGDDIIVGQIDAPFVGLLYVTRNYSTGLVNFSVEPVRVQ